MPWGPLQYHLDIGCTHNFPGSLQSTKPHEVGPICIQMIHKPKGLVLVFELISSDTQSGFTELLYLCAEKWCCVKETNIIGKEVTRGYFAMSFNFSVQTIITSLAQAEFADALMHTTHRHPAAHPI